MKIFKKVVVLLALSAMLIGILAVASGCMKVNNNPNDIPYYDNYFYLEA